MYKISPAAYSTSLLDDLALIRPFMSRNDGKKSIYAKMKHKRVLPLKGEAHNRDIAVIAVEFQTVESHLVTFSPVSSTISEPQPGGVVVAWNTLYIRYHLHTVRRFLLSDWDSLKKRCLLCTWDLSARSFETGCRCRSSCSIDGERHEQDILGQIATARHEFLNRYQETRRQRLKTTWQLEWRLCTTRYDTMHNSCLSAFKSVASWVRPSANVYWHRPCKARVTLRSLTIENSIYPHRPDFPRLTGSNQTYRDERWKVRGKKDTSFRSMSLKKEKCWIWQIGAAFLTISFRKHFSSLH